MDQRIIQIATFGKDFNDIINGIRNFPTSNLVLLHYQEDKNDAEEFSYDIHRAFGIPVYLRMISKPDVIKSGIEHVTEIVTTAKPAKILMNVSAGDKSITCAALISAFVNGVMAFGFHKYDQPLLFPLLKLDYAETISDEKIKILKALHLHGGTMTLGLLAKATRLGKSLLSYHLHGDNKSGRRGLTQRGLVNMKIIEERQSEINLSTLGKLAVHSK